jgi:hypothetical protein
MRRVPPAVQRVIVVADEVAESASAPRYERMQAAFTG